MSRTHISVGALILVVSVLLISNPTFLEAIAKGFSSTIYSLTHFSARTQTAAVAPVPYSNNLELSTAPLQVRSASLERYYNPYRARSGVYMGKVRILGAQGGVFVRFSVPGNLTPGVAYTLSSYLSESNKKEEFGRLSVAVSINGGALIRGNDISPFPWSSWSKSEVTFIAPQSGYVEAYAGYGEEQGGEFDRGEFWFDDVLVAPAVTSGPRLEARINPYVRTGALPVDALGLALGQVVLNAVGSTQPVELNSLIFSVDTQASSYPSSFSNFGLYDGARLVSIGFIPQSFIPGATSTLSFHFPYPLILQPGVNKALTLRGDSGFIWPAQGAYTLNLTNASASVGTTKSGVSVSTSGSAGGSVANSSTGSNTFTGPTGNNCFEPLAPPGDCKWTQGIALPPAAGGNLYFRNWIISHSARYNYAPKCESAGGSDSRAGTQTLIRGYAGCHCKFMTANTAVDPTGGFLITYQENPMLQYPDKTACCLNTAPDGSVSGLPYNPQQQICCSQSATSKAHLRPRCTNESGGPLYEPGDVCTPSGLPANVKVIVPNGNTDGCCPTANQSPSMKSFLDGLPPQCEAIITSGNNGCHEDDSRHYSGCAIDLITSNAAACGLSVNPPGVYGTGKCTPPFPGSSLYHCQLCDTRP